MGEARIQKHPYELIEHLAQTLTFLAQAAQFVKNVIQLR
jgi:hypothetical protein